MAPLQSGSQPTTLSRQIQLILSTTQGGSHPQVISLAHQLTHSTQDQAPQSASQGPAPKTSSVQVSSTAQSRPTLYATDGSTPGFPEYHQQSELTQTHVHQVGDAFQPSHPLSSPPPTAFNLSQHQGLFK